MNSTCKAAGCLLLCSLCLSLALGQVTNISGIVNEYAHVSAIDIGNNAITVSNTTPFSFDDSVLLIQMKGSEIVRTNTSSFGDISDLNGAGTYQLLRVCDVNTSTNQVVLQETIDPAFATTDLDSAGLQLVSIPSYAGDVRVNGVLSAKAWDGQTGGVLILEVDGSLMLDGDIDLDGLGFRGGAARPMGGSCSTISLYGDEYYSFGSRDGGLKGEGIAAYIPGRETGRGPQANGGGGGNNHNSGGAGGGNIGLGGGGGNRSASIFNCKGLNPGRSGSSLATRGYSAFNPRVFMGGGGGAGHGNNGDEADGGKGGGIAFIFADEINSSGRFISARGINAGLSGSDGGSGGGGGGSIILEVSAITGTLDIDVGGGNGGSTSIVDCQGPGGGGGGGAIWSSISLPGGVTTNVNGGTAGIATVGGCGGNQGAGNGGNGGVLLNYSKPTPTGTACVLPTLWTHLKGSSQPGGIRLSGEVVDVRAYDYQIEVRRRQEGNWEFLDRFQVEGEDGGRLFPDWIDRSPLPGVATYRMDLIDIDGRQISSPLVEVFWEPAQSFDWRPISSESRNKLRLWVENPEASSLILELYAMDGSLCWKEKVEVPAYRGVLEFEVPRWSKMAGGVYGLSINRRGRRSFKKILR